MFSIRNLRLHLYPLFKIMREANVTIDVVYRGVVYELHVTKTDKKPKLTRAKRVNKQVIQSIPAEQCKECGGMTMAGICMSRSCPSNN